MVTFKSLSTEIVLNISVKGFRGKISLLTSIKKIEKLNINSVTTSTHFLNLGKYRIEKILRRATAKFVLRMAIKKTKLIAAIELIKAISPIEIGKSTKKNLSASGFLNLSNTSTSTIMESTTTEKYKFGNKDIGAGSF